MFVERTRTSTERGLSYQHPRDLHIYPEVSKISMICTVAHLFQLSFWHHLVSSFTRDFIRISQSWHFALGEGLNSKPIPHAIRKVCSLEKGKKNEKKSTNPN